MRAKQILCLTTTILGRRYGTSRMHLSTKVAKAAVRSKGMAILVVDLLLIVGSIVCRSSVLVLVLLFSTLCPFRFSIILIRMKELVALL